MCKFRDILPGKVQVVSESIREIVRIHISLAHNHALLGPHLELKEFPKASPGQSELVELQLTFASESVSNQPNERRSEGMNIL